MKNIYVSYEKTDTYYLFTDSEGNKMYMPATAVILVDDESGAIAVKNIATRKTVGLVIDGQPVPPKPQYRWVDDGFTCKGFDKWQQMKQQESTDSGATWHDTGVVSATSLIEKDSEDCGYIPPTTGNYLTFRAVEDGTFSFTDSINYSLDSGATWTALAANTQTPTISAGDTVMWKRNNGVLNGKRFTSTAKYEVEGNIMSMIFGDDFEDKTDLTGYDNAFKGLFSGNTHLTSAERLSLPATTLSNNCYENMFSSCTSLSKIPQMLPATTLAEFCYNEMFSYCSSITALTDNYLPATTLPKNCYSNMFEYTSIVNLENFILPATDMQRDTYLQMFQYCSSLQKAPELPPANINTGCYARMFKNCTSLTKVPSILDFTPADGSTDHCQEMFIGCTSITESPILPLKVLKQSTYARMFSGCRNLSKITCLATNKSASMCLVSWVKSVASTGTFYKAAGASWSTGVNGIPRNWNVEEQQ